MVAARGSHRDALSNLMHQDVPPYMSVELEKLRFTLDRRPKRTEAPIQCEIQLVVEHYSR